MAEAEYQDQNHALNLCSVGQLYEPKLTTMMDDGWMDEWEGNFAH
jgi:hypothetical protein